MINPDEQYTYLSWPPNVIWHEDLSGFPDWDQSTVPEAMRFFRAQLTAMGRVEDASRIDENTPVHKISAMVAPNGRMIGTRWPLLVKKGETAEWNPVTKTYEIRQRQR